MTGSDADLEVARADLNAARALVEESGAVAYEPLIREELGRLRGAETELREAVRSYEAIGAAGHAGRLATELGYASVQPSSSSRVEVER